MSETAQTPAEDVFWGRCDPAEVASGPFKFDPPHWREDGTCSHCGGMRPSLILKAIREGSEVEPTDKNYKIYVNMPDPDVGKMEVFAGRNHPPEAGDTSWLHVDEALKAAHPHINFNNHFGEWVQIGPRRATRNVKCYFNHFSESQAVEFVLLAHTGKMKLAYPGHFYSGMCFGVYKTAIQEALKKLEAEENKQPPENSQ